MSVNLNLWKDFFDHSVFPDNEGCSLDTQSDFSVERLLLVHAIFSHHLFGGIGQQRHIQLIFVPKTGLFIHAVRADSYGDCTFLFDLRLGITEPACLTRSAGRTGFRIEKEHYGFLPCIIAQSLYVAAIVID